MMYNEFLIISDLTEDDVTVEIYYPQKEWSGDYTDSIANIKRRLESWKD